MTPVYPPPVYPPPLYPRPHAPAAQSITVTNRFDRDVLWLTWDAPTRLDVLLRNSALEASVRIPLGARYALSLARTAAATPRARSRSASSRADGKQNGRRSRSARA